MEQSIEKINFLTLLDKEIAEKDNRPNSFAQYTTTSKNSTEVSVNSKRGIDDTDFSNFFRDSQSLRKTYYEKLLSKSLLSTSVFHPEQSAPKKRTHNSIILFDWDDTLLCSSYLMKHSFFENEQNVQNKISDSHKEKIAKLEFQVLRVLTIALTYGDVYIITNASQGWVEYSANKFFPSITKLLSQITIISARTLYGEQYPEDSRMWKISTFSKVAEIYDKNIVTNIICMGDSYLEMEAAQKMSSLFKEVFLKTVKFREDPKPEQIIKQLSLVSEQFKAINSAVRNISIMVEKKSKKK